MSTSQGSSAPVLGEFEFNRTVAALSREYKGIFADETIARFVTESLERWPAPKVRAHVEVLAYRFTRERLRALGQAEGTIAKEHPEVLFVCVHNAGRSQMAAGLLAKHARGKVHVRSAGSTPADEINDAVVQAMSEVDVDISAEYPKPLTDEFVRASDVVITMGCGDACPIFPGKRYLDWELDDPAGKTVEEVRPIRDELDRRVRALLAELVGDA
ncbi:MAG TPA: arsenate reductase ArsC [Actinomycetota bacterium]